jgi:hypothetical protein
MAANPGADKAPSASPLALLREDSLGVGLLVGALLLMLLLFLWLATSYSSLPDLLPLHFDANGNPDRIGERQEVFVLPAIGLVINLVNIAAGLVARIRFRMVFAAYLLWAGALMVQLLLWVALWNITH